MSARGHQTKWAAQFAVASELCKRGYEVSLTMGNAPAVDLLAISPKLRKPFAIQVKGLYSKNPWIVDKKAIRADLYYVLAFVPTSEPNQFFVMTQKQVNDAIDGELTRLGRPQDYKVKGFLWSIAQQHKDRWDALPE